MAEDEYIKKMENLQQYIPFLNNMIAQLKDPNKKNREQQLSKMESLHAMITDKKKKLKLETLNKCEDVISKLYFKVNHKPLNLLQRDPLHSPGLTQSPRSTPASPSPSRDMKDVFDIRPLPIPVERLEPESRIPKVDIYSSAAESLNKPRPSNDIHPKVPDMSKPPISLEDLKGLEEDVHEKINAGASLNELNSMRNKIAHQIILEQMKSMSPSSKQKEEIDTPDRNNSSSPQPTDKGKKEETPKDSPKRFSTDIDKKSPRTDSPRRAIQINLKPKPSPKVLSEPASIFGNVLVTIDDKIIEDTKKDRRSSLTKEEKVKAEEKSSTDESKKKEEKSKEKTKERRISTSSRDEKKSEGKGSDKTKEKEGESLENNSEHKEKSSKQKSDSKESRKDEKSRSTEQDKRKDDRKKIDKRRESSSIDRKSKNEHRTLDKLKETKGKDQIANEDIFQIEDGTKDQKNSAGSIKSQIVVKKIEDLREPKVNAIASLISKQIEELKGMNRETADANKDTPVYKRLADKYNPKPRKLAVDSDVDKAVADSIEANMKISPPKIPILNRLSDVPPPPASLVKCSQLEPEMPNVLQKIMNPSTTQLINTMVNQLRQTNVESDRMMTPIPSTSSLIQPVPHPGHKTPLLLNPPLLPNPPLLSKAPLLPNPSLVHNPSLLMSPTDSFVSEYARDDNFVSDYSRDDYGCTNPAAMRSELRFDQSSTISMNNRFIPPSINQPRFNQAYNNFNHNQVENIHQLDYYPPNAPLPSNQFNGGPPLLSPETPHFQEHKNISFGMTDRNFLQKEDLRWRLDDNRVQWDRRDFDTRYRGPTTYREYREMRENSRDPRVARDPRENRDPRDSRDPRDNSRDSRDPRDNSRDSRDPRDNSRDNRDPRDTRDPRINRDSSRDPRDSRDSRDPRDVRDPRLNRDFERGRSRGREDYRSGRYESKFDRIYARTNRERSRSRSATNDKESFVSPLDSLYSGKEEHKTGKGYGKQSFRIPKIKKEADPVKTEPTHDVLIVPDDSGNENKDDAPENCENRDQESDDGVDNDNVHNVDTDDSDGAPEEAESKGSIESKEVERVQEKECKPKPVFSEVNTSADTEEIKISNIKDPELSSSSDGTKDVKVLDQMDKDSTALREADLQNEGETQHEVKSQEQKQELKPPAEQTILAQFFANLLGSQNKKEKKTALYSLISTFSDSFSSKELSKITKIIKADDDEDSSEDEEVHRKKTANVEQEKSKIEPDVEMASEASQKKIDFLEEETVLHKEDTVLEEKTLPEGDTLPEEDALPEEDSTPEKEIVPKRRLRKRIRRVSSESPKGERKKESNEEDESGKTTPSDIDKSTEGDVVVTVGERIKSRKRISVNSVKPRKKCRSELDKLHEDIQDMFIRDGVLTATGKRMCHLLKDDPHALSPSAPSTSETEEPPRVRKKPGPKPKIRHSEATEVNAMKHVRVIISKIPESEMQDSEKYSRRLTRSMTFLESDDETSVHETESTKELSDGENDSESESSDTEKEGLSQANESNQNIKTKRKLKRKRGSGWASGIIKKVKKKKTLLEEPVPQTDEETAEDSIANDFLEPDKDYYVDFAMQKSYACKLCDFQGKFITTHYKSSHPDSEVLSSRFTPSVAAEAIADAKKNMSRYEACLGSKGAKKISFTCRFCTANTIVFPTLFYDHLSTHTGEYRHICPNCNISFCGAKTLKFHMNTGHKDEAKPIVRKSYNSTIMFGYLCGECNYVQVNEKNVEEHVNIYHLVRPPIYKVNLSSHFDEEIEKMQKTHDSSDSVTAVINEVVQNDEENNEVPEPVPVRKKPGPKKKSIAIISEPPTLSTDADPLEKTQPEIVPPKRRRSGPKPGPKSKKKMLEKKHLQSKEVESDCTTDTESVSSKQSMDSDREGAADKPTRIRSDTMLDTEKILPIKSKRAAKAKAQEKLKVIMELNDKSFKRSSSNENIEKKDTCKSKDKEGSDKEEQASINENKEKKKVDESTKEDSEVNSEKIAKEVVKKEIEMNVFTCKTDIQEENKKIEQERLKTMDELNRSVGSRTSLNFVDKLCNRLSKNDIILKQEPTDDLTDSLFRRESSQSPLSMPILEKNPPTIPPNIPTDIPSSVPPVIESVEPAIETPITPPVTQPRIKNPVLEPEDPHLLSPSYDVTQKNDRIIVDMIEKLKGKLGTPGTENDSSVDNAINIEDDDDDEGPPPLTHVNQLVNIKPTDSFTKTLQIGGLVKLIKTVDSTTFCCLVPPCVFSTDHKDVFQRHCRERHAASSLGRNTTLCEICGVQIETTLEASLLENLFKHTITEHADFLKDTVISSGLDQQKADDPQQPGAQSADAEANVSPQKRMLRIRKLSGDALSVIKKDWEEEIDIHQGKSQANNPSDNNEDNQTVEAATKTTDVSAEEEAAPSFAEIETTDDNPFPFKIAGVMSLAEPQPPPLTPIAKQSMHLVVKEAKLNTAELAKPKKTPKALNKFIEDVSNLYKCPHYFCLFTTNFRDFLERHLKAHNTEQDAMIPCVYCDLKTPWEHVPMHIDIRHANCRFSCSYCLYRAAVKEYVFLHQDRAHPTKDYSVIALPSMKIHKKFAIADVKIDPKTLCEPYKCTQFCSMEFLFENEFRKHLIEFHNQSTFMSCGHENCRSRVLACKMTQHWSSVHNVSLYQCGYCKMSCSDIKQMYHHFSKSHQNLTPDILIRMVTPVPDTITLGYSAEAFRRMRKIVSIPSNITSDDKTDKSPLPPSKLVPNLTTSAPPNSKTTAIQIVTSLPQNSISGTIVLPSGVKSSPGSFTLVTSSSPNTPVNNSLFFISSSPTNSLLKPPNAKIGSPLASTSKTDMVDATSLEPSLIPSLAISSVPMNSTPILITSTPSPSVTAIASPSIPEKINVPPTESNGTSVAPLEHITLSEEQVSEVPESDVDPLDLGETTKPQCEPFSSDDESDAPASIPEKMNKDAEKKNGLLGYQLYRCAFCDFSCSNSNDFKKHVSRSMACRKVNNPAKPFECVHCGKGLRNPHVFIDHIQIHGVLRFSCSLCGNKFPTATQARGHMKHRHNVNQISLTPLNPTKNNVDTDEYIIKPKLPSVLEPKESPQSEPTASISMDDTVYTPDQIDSIPIRSIFSSDIRCGICSYSTKVRTNLVRHLQFHSQEKSVPDTAPVNPVPCLEKNEKMFDKMMNLASSSHTSASKMGGSGKPDNKEAENLPEYVSPQYRYCCCAQNCNYICPEEGNLRHHLMALHNDETSFTCAHCKADITPTDVDNIIKHLKLHGLQLFKCSHCDFVHYQKNKVEKHVNDHHADLPSKVITVRYMESEPKDPTEELSLLDGPSTPTNNQLKSKDKPWRCCMCKTRNNSQEGIQNHVLEKHEIDSQYKCALCAYKTNEKDTFEEHFKDHHTNQEINIIHVYRKVEDGPKDDKDKDADPFDTTPLWQRDRPRVRHIRGILFDESSPVPAKSPKKPPKAVTTPTSSASTSKATSNLDLAIDSVAKGTNILKDDELIQQVNKIMKNSKESPSKTNDSDSDVIIIEDEDEISDESKTTKTKGSLKRKTIEVAGISKIPRLEDVIDLANMSAVEEKYDEYSPENLKGAFGEFGQPLNRQLKCPVCNKFKSKRISDFIFHMFKEKKVYRFKCGICSDESITYRYMAKHVKEHKHDTDFRDKIIELPANPRLEVWIQMLISFQCSKILPSLNPVPEASIPKDQRELCRYCNKWFRSEQERNEHAISHWRIVPHGCESCHFLAFTKAQVEKHNEQSHANVIMNIIEKGPTVTNEIKHTDDLHRMEAEDRTHKDKPSIAEVIVTASQPLDMEDESQQDGTVEGMTSVGEGSSLLDESSTSAETNPLEICEITDVDDFESPDDLFIITKTDTNVPVDGDVYCCEYCPYMSSSEMLIMSHISGQHEHMHIKFKVLNNGMCESKKSDYVGCALCTETGSEIRIRKHHLDKHDGQTFMMFRYTCTTCQKRFMKLPGLKTHSIRTHPGVPVRYTGIFDNTVQDAGKPQKKKAAPDETDPTGLKPNKPKPLYKRTWKTYQCSKCPYRRDFASNNVNNVRVHVRSHFKAYSCGECRMKFKSNTEATHHYNKDHPEQTEDMSINFDEIIEDEYQVTIAAVFRDAFVIVKDSTSPPPSPVQPPKTLKSTARKSTSAPQKTPQEEYSFYGLPVEEVDLTKISTSVEINGMRLNMSADKLGKIFDLDPQVQVKDCNDTVDLTGLFDS